MRVLCSSSFQYRNLLLRAVAEPPPAQNNLPGPNHGSEKSDWLEQTNKQTLTIFNEPITLSFRKGNNQFQHKNYRDIKTHHKRLSHKKIEIFTFFSQVNRVPHKTADN